MVGQGLRDSEPHVRRPVSSALAQLAEHCHPGAAPQASGSVTPEPRACRGDHTGTRRPDRSKTRAALQVVGQGLQDSEPHVRGQAAFALAQLAEHCQPEIGQHARAALPHVLNALSDGSTVVQEQAFLALVALCDSLGGACSHSNQRQHEMRGVDCLVMGAAKGDGPACVEAPPS